MAHLIPLLCLSVLLHLACNDQSPSPPENAKSLATSHHPESAPLAQTGTMVKTTDFWIGIPKGESSMSFLKVSKGTEVKILEEESGYYKINHRDLIGYVGKNLVKLTELEEISQPELRPEPDPEPVLETALEPEVEEVQEASYPEVAVEEVAVEKPAPKADPNDPSITYTVTRETSLRTDPDSRATVLIRLPEGGKLEVLDPSGKHWWKVHYKGRTGWAKSALLKKG